MVPSSAEAQAQMEREDLLLWQQRGTACDVRRPPPNHCWCERPVGHPGPGQHHCYGHGTWNDEEKTDGPE